MNNYFHFTAKEIKGTIALLVILTGVAGVIHFYYKLNNARLYPTNYANELSSLPTFQKNTPAAKTNYYNYSNPSKTKRPTLLNYQSQSVPGKTFEFDPNTASKEEWIRLGLSERTANTIENYLSKGGKFRKAEDIRKIYGLNASLAEKLIPFVRINPMSVSSNQTPYQKESKNWEPKRAAFVQKAALSLNINQADTAALIALPGIGPAFAKRIVKFREKLGGFYSIDQVAETYGLPDSTFKIIRDKLVLDGEIKKININEADANSLKHPYINYNLAKAIVSFRQQHGNFSDVGELKKLHLLDETLFQKISPYLTVN